MEPEDVTELLLSHDKTSRDESLLLTDEGKTVVSQDEITVKIL